MSKEDKKNDKPSFGGGGMKAKKDFVLNCPQSKKKDSYRKNIKEGDDLSDVPKKFHQGLKTEGVL